MWDGEGEPKLCQDRLRRLGPQIQEAERGGQGLDSGGVKEPADGARVAGEHHGGGGGGQRGQKRVLTGGQTAKIRHQGDAQAGRGEGGDDLLSDGRGDDSPMGALTGQY